ncbi:MAG: hypothetical protein LBR10_00820 [Prevotellaceae bacterium]|jgi:hypothetical protein|nr:hypothetical protein [Prevotellaceae bacterium]
MNIDELYEEINKLLPVVRDSDDFIDDLKKALNKYSALLKSLDSTYLCSIDINRIESLVESIKRCIKYYYEGLHSAAFSEINMQLSGDGEKLKGLLDTINLYTIQKDVYLYRGRIFDDNRAKTYKDMFHIPLEERGVVQTQRYSFPGYPCLYIGCSIQACWEELKRPKFDNLMISGFKATRNIPLFDLRIPSQEDYEERKLGNTLLRLPLIISCSIKVKNEKDNYKPEYIIPQLLTESIISINRKRREIDWNLDDFVLGVIYTSVYFNDDLKYQSNISGNIAIPVLDVSQSKGSCNILAECFCITNPTCYEYEEIRKDFSMDPEYIVLSQTTSPNQNYILSKPGKLEFRIKTLSVNQFDYIIIPPSITLSSVGSVVQVPIRASGDWRIEEVIEQ